VRAEAAGAAYSYRQDAKAIGDPASNDRVDDFAFGTGDHVTSLKTLCQLNSATPMLLTERTLFAAVTYRRLDTFGLPAISSD
jgi:hypothetical protein